MNLDYRTALDTDAPAASRVITLALNDLAARQHRLPFAAPDDHAVSILRHVMATDADRFWMAVDDDRPIAFGAAWVRDRLSYCGGLFVLPGYQGQGVGRRLFERAFEGLPAAGGVAALTSSAGNSVSNGLYARRGIFPLYALLYLSGPVPPASAVTGRRLSPSLDLEPEPLTLAHLDDLRGIDDAVLGCDRTVDHRWLLGVAGHSGWLFRLRSRPAGYAYLGGDGTGGAGALGPVATLRAHDQEPVLRFALAQLALLGIERATVAVPGPNVVAQRLLWQAGFAFPAPTGLLCTSRPFGRFDRYLLAGDCLM